MHMMAMFGSARERTEAEFRALLTAAGFDLRRVIPTASLVTILDAVPQCGARARLVSRGSRGSG
jgi:hypothetical protein